MPLLRDEILEFHISSKMKPEGALVVERSVHMYVARRRAAHEICSLIELIKPLTSPGMVKQQVAYMHDKDIIHRDLKGANLLISNTG